MNFVCRVVGLVAAMALMACEKPVAESTFEQMGEHEIGEEAQVMHLVFQDECASWNGASVKVSIFEDHWALDGFAKRDCKKPALFEQRYELDSQFLGVWEQTLVIEVGTADADRELYLLDPVSGDRIAELWYVDEPIFGDSGITYYEPTREPAKLDHCPQNPDELKLWQEQGVKIMYSSKKHFELETKETKTLLEKGCYSMR